MPGRRRIAYHGAFGDDAFGRFAERTARFFGTPRYIVGQTIIVAVWIVVNGVYLAHPFDRYPFILLNLIFSTQAAYAAPLILLAQTRQAERDKSHGDYVEERHTALEQATDRATSDILKLLNTNTEITQQDKQLTEEVAKLAKEIHTLLTQRGSG
ncbi:MAG TPA: DUF1003 domain-containing protein [Gaiellaceae bacterium]|nr:DUF1003 domain-containing protein [Gaiellaceae bacterium]